MIARLTELVAAKAMSSESAGSDSLLGQYRNVDEVFDDQVLAKPTGEVFHRLEPQSDRLRPACHSCRDEDEIQLTSPEAVYQAGLKPCRTCYQAIFEYLASRPESPVESRPPVTTEEISAEVAENFAPVQPDSRPAPLTALTEEVMVTGGSSKVMHAPTPKGPHCARTGDYRRIDRSVVAGHYRPCEECFVDIDE